ncbi:MAG: hypothetical protein ACYC5J_14835 [Chloroflexota bacterium]
MSSLGRFRVLVGFALGFAVLVTTGYLPISQFDDGVQVAVEATRALLGVLLLLSLAGWGVGDLLLPSTWKPYELLLAPLIGVVVLVPAAYYLNSVLDMTAATGVLLVAAALLALRRSLGRDGTAPLAREMVAPLVAASALLVASLYPQLVQGSLALLALNNDEEAYFYPAQYLLTYPMGRGLPDMVMPSFANSFTFYRTEGWGFQYLLAATSAITAVPTFHAYLPAVFALLSLGAPAWYLFFRHVLLLSPRAAGLAVLLYAAHGLPLWFASYGYGKQMGWIALTPLALSALTTMLRHKDARSVLLLGLSVGSLLFIETRVGAVHVAVTLVCLGVYWLAVDRRLSVLGMLVSAAAVALIAGGPALYPFLQDYVASGVGLGMLQSGQGLLLSWGPGLSGFPSLGVLFGLEANELAKIMDPVQPLAGLEPVGAMMGDVAPYMSGLLLLIAAVGALSVARQNPVALVVVSGFFAWMVATRIVIQFPYGYLKLFGVAAPILVGLEIAGALQLVGLSSKLRFLRPSPQLHYAILAVAGAVLFMFLARNSFHSIVFGAQGWGISLPPSLVRATAAIGRATEMDSRVFVTGKPDYPIPDGSVLLRKDHRLAMQTRDELSGVWAYKLRSIVAANLIGRHVGGVFKTGIFQSISGVPESGYDYRVLLDNEDPRLQGLDRSDVVAVAGALSLYEAPSRGWLGSEEILSKRGTLQIDAAKPLTLLVGPNQLSFETLQGEAAGSDWGRVRLGILSLTETTTDVRVGDQSRLLALDPGLSWYTTPSLVLPSTIRMTSDDPIRIVSVRVLPPGDEGIDRCNDTVVSTEAIKLDDGGVSLDLWFSNPMRDAKGATAGIVAGEERRFALAVSEIAQRWILRFLPNDPRPKQLLNGVVETPMEPLPWLANGGLLSLRLHIGREEPKEIPLAVAQVINGRISRLDRFTDPVSLKLWGHDDRPKDKLLPDVETLEGTLVRGPSGFPYLVQNGQRRWLPDPPATLPSADGGVLSREQVWLIPPGLPLP